MSKERAMFTKGQQVKIDGTTLGTVVTLPRYVDGARGPQEYVMDVRNDEGQFEGHSFPYLVGRITPTEADPKYVRGHDEHDGEAVTHAVRLGSTRALCGEEITLVIPQDFEDAVGQCITCVERLVDEEQLADGGAPTPEDQAMLDEAERNAVQATAKALWPASAAEVEHHPTDEQLARRAELVEEVREASELSKANAQAQRMADETPKEQLDSARDRLLAKREADRKDRLTEAVRACDLLGAELQALVNANVTSPGRLEESLDQLAHWVAVARKANGTLEEPGHYAMASDEALRITHDGSEWTVRTPLGTVTYPRRVLELKMR